MQVSTFELKLVILFIGPEEVRGILCIPCNIPDSSVQYASIQRFPVPVQHVDKNINASDVAYRRNKSSLRVTLRNPFHAEDESPIK